MNSKYTIYFYVALLFVLTYLFASRVFTSLKTNEFDFVKLGINAVLLAYIIYQIVKLGKINNDKTDL
ncbi:MAG: hypothetical protein H7239_03140 [Flavobacterium sp.]|nr:hypothetical protein [Flavobacterium sp.]